MNYTVRAAAVAPALDAEWTDPAWGRAETLEIRHFRPESSSHHPQTSVRLLYVVTGIYGIFRVQDRYVRCVRTQYMQEVWKDSCVEFFAQPRLDRGYFNFEFNCGGAFLCSYITNPERTPEGFKEFTRVPAEIGQRIQARSSLPQRIDPEITAPVLWTLRFFIPFSLFGQYLGALGAASGQEWRGNFFKCADESSHPHWGCWSPVDELNFHRPSCFGTIRFE
ncbi:MAG TPA: carbohydrate-binding family 9-like protein [Candidatus Paceibacterota bacterium]|nr:carbohydrate-binding family 9-like protein [Verrucomicrobiota bacterium]HSA10127.1 carbohydrate-binding family 9-like protein [Candidatus Paceibacterota bacterium]